MPKLYITEYFLPSPYVKLEYKSEHNILYSQIFSGFLKKRNVPHAGVASPTGITVKPEHRAALEEALTHMNKAIKVIRSSQLMPEGQIIPEYTLSHNNDTLMRTIVITEKNYAEIPYVVVKYYDDLNILDEAFSNFLAKHGVQHETHAFGPGLVVRKRDLDSFKKALENVNKTIPIIWHYDLVPKIKENIQYINFT